LEAVACDISFEDVQINTNGEPIEQTVQQENKDAASASFVEGGPVTQMDHDMSASVVSPGGHPQPTLASPLRAEANATFANRRRHTTNTEQSVVPFERVQDDDVIVKIAVYHNHKAQKAQEFLVLGSQPLTVLRDRIYCLSDHTLEGGRTKSGYLFFENVFYDDLRDHESIEYSKSVINWAEETKQHNPEKENPKYSSKPMHSTTFNDLVLRVNAAYVYCHQGSCEHLVFVTDIRLLNEEDERNKNTYPLQTFQAKIRRRKCRICDIYPAKFVTFGDKLSPENPCFYCDKCYQPLHYSADDLLLYQGFEVYPYYHE